MARSRIGKWVAAALAVVALVVFTFFAPPNKAVEASDPDSLMSHLDAGAPPELMTPAPPELVHLRLGGAS